MQQSSTDKTAALKIDSEWTSEDKFDPFKDSQSVAKVEGVRVLRLDLGDGDQIGWHRSHRAYTSIFANDEGVVVQLQRPPVRCTLSAGEVYTIPPNVVANIYGKPGKRASFTIFQYGESLEASPAEPPTLAFLYDRSLPNVERKVLPGSAEVDYDTTKLHPGLRQLQILVSRPDIRLIIQGHGADECVPWHSHDNIADTFFCIQGFTLVATRTPEKTQVLAPGDVFSVPAGIPHFVCAAGGEPCLMLVLQGVGRYNYVAEPQ